MSSAVTVLLLLFQFEFLFSFSSLIAMTRASTLTTVIQHSLEVLVMAIREEKEKRNSNWKRRSKTVTADDMILYIENPKEATKKLLELISEFGKVEGYKINAEKSLAFVYTNNKRSEREIQKTIPFTIATKIVK